MRFIVDFYRYVILFLIALTIVIIVFTTLLLLTGSDAFSNMGTSFFLIATAILILEVMALGITATFISIHDRHAEIVDELREWRHSIKIQNDGNHYEP